MMYGATADVKDGDGSEGPQRRIEALARAFRIADRIQTEHFVTQGIVDKLADYCTEEGISDGFAMTFYHAVEPTILARTHCLRRLSRSRLMEVFGHPHIVLDDPATVDAFCALPIEVVRDWLDISSLSSHSEN